VRNNNGKRLAKLEQLFAATTDEVSTLHVEPNGWKPIWHCSRRADATSTLEQSIE
jgi:hypothetical protein